MSSKTQERTERFDLNQVKVSGVIQRLWSRGADILLRLAVAGRSAEHADQFTLVIPGGGLDRLSPTLMKADRISVVGHIQDFPYLETGLQFAERSRSAEKLLSAIPSLGEIVSERMATWVVVHSLEAEAGPANEVILDGIVSRVWNRREQLFARLAIYDPYTEVIEKTGKNNRLRRQAHYASVHFLDGIVQSRSVKLAQKDRLRVRGVLSERRYSESLAMFLMRTQKIGLLANAADADELREIRVPRAATYVVADSLIQFG